MALYEQTSRQVFGMVVCLVSDSGAAEEVLLDVYTRAWKQAASYDANKASVLAWLSGIAGMRVADRAVMLPHETEPPEYLRDLLAARVERETQEEAVQSAPPEGKRVAPVSARGTTPASSPLFAPSPQERSRFPWLLVAAFALAAGIGFFAWRQSNDETKRLNASLATAQADLTNLRTLLEVQRGRSAELDQINSFINVPGARVIHLQGQATAPTSSAVVFWDVGRKRCLVVGSFPPPPDGKVYQLWFTAPQASASAGVLLTDPLGHVFKTIEITQDPAKVTGAAVTLEPEGGSVQPTPPLIAVGQAAKL